MKKLQLILIATMVLLASVGTVAAWGVSSNVAVVDDATSCSALGCSSSMGNLATTELTTNGFAGTATRVPAASLTAAEMAKYDTIILFFCNPSTLADKPALVKWVQDGHKLIIWDSEDQYTFCPAANRNCWDYSWLPGALQFSQSIPGPQGASGSLTINVPENGILSSSNPANPNYINAATLASGTDAVGDSNTFTNFVTQEWCIDMTATNVLQKTGPVHAYTKGPSVSVGDGLIVYTGFDWDDHNSGAGLQLPKIMAQELKAGSLPCTQISGELKVTKIADKPSYNVGDAMKFTIKVKNLANGLVNGVVITEVPFSPYVGDCDQTTINVGNLDAGEESVEYVVNCVAKDAPNNCVGENSAKAVGYVGGLPLVFGSEKITFDLFPAGATSCGTPSPEFPTVALPIGMILGIAFVVYSVRKN